jgi:HTH-type transcriptional regulator, cell division transcriptional repressor
MSDATDAGWYSNETATLGDRLAAAREQSGLTQAELAARLGVRAATVARWEDDQDEPRANRLQMLSGMLGVSLVWLLTGTGDGPAAPATDDAAPAADLAGLLTEMRALRGSMTVAVTRMGLIEKQLRRVGGGRQ